MVSAVCKFKPKLPARVLNMKMKYGEVGSLNCSKSFVRSSDYLFVDIVNDNDG